MHNSSVITAQTTRPTIYVMVGLPGAGKTIRARQLEAERQALRLTPDEWMIPLFGESEAGGKRDDSRAGSCGWRSELSVWAST